MASDLKDILSNAYENFFMRDLIYIFGGGLILGASFYAVGGDILEGLNFVSANFFKFTMFLVLAYFVGLVFNDLAKRLKIIQGETLGSLPFNFTHLMAEIQKQWGPSSIKRIERCIYFRNVGSIIGVASLISAVILIYPIIKNHQPGEIVIYCFLVIGGIVCLFEHESISRGIQEDLEDFWERLNRENGNNK